MKPRYRAKSAETLHHKDLKLLVKQQTGRCQSLSTTVAEHNEVYSLRLSF